MPHELDPNPNPNPDPNTVFVSLSRAEVTALQSRILQLEDAITKMAEVNPGLANIIQRQPPGKEPKVAEPAFFSGNRSEVPSFLRVVHLNFQLNPSRFPPNDEYRRILFALTYFRGGTAGVWGDNHTASMADPDPRNRPFATFAEFETAFKAAFGDSDRAQRARIDLANLKMKPGDSVEEFTTSFEALAVHTGYNEAAHIEAYRAGLHHRIVEKIYSDSNGELPADLDAWKTKARRLDNLYREYKAIQASHTQSTRPRPPPPKPPVPVVPASAPTLQSDAMDVDGHSRRFAVRCFNCKGLGHIARNCPQPARERSVRVADIAEVVRTVLAETKVPQEETVVKTESDFQESQQ